MGLNAVSGKRFGLVVAAITWFALILQLWLSIRLSLMNGNSVGHGIAVYLSYFTVLTNLLVALVATLSVTATARAGRHSSSAQVQGCATASIVLVGIAYHLLLRHAWDPQGWQWLADVLMHYAVPAAFLLYWWLTLAERSLPWWSPLPWCAYPLGYFAYALVRGHFIGSYPYPFIDVTTLGIGRAFVNALGVLVGFLAIGFVLVASTRYGTSATNASGNPEAHR